MSFDHLAGVTAARVCADWTTAEPVLQVTIKAPRLRDELVDALRRHRRGSETGALMNLQFIICNIAIVSGALAAGAYCLWIAVKKGCIEQKTERRGEVFEGPDAIRAGVFWLGFAGLAWCAAIYWIVLLREGRVHW